MIKWNPEEYSKNSSQIEIWAMEMLQKFIVNGSECILDIGSGDGRITAAISKLLPKGKVTGIDSSMEMISFSKDKFGGREFPNLEFIQLDVRELDFINRFDIVFSNATLHWLTDHKPILKLIYRSLKPDGKIIFQMGGKGNQEDLVKLVEKTVQNDKWEPLLKGYIFKYGYYDTVEYSEWLKEAGYNKISVNLINKENIINGPGGLKNWIRLAFSPYTAKIPEDRKSEFIDEIAENYLRKYQLDEHGICRIPMKRLVVEASK